MICHSCRAAALRARRISPARIISAAAAAARLNPPTTTTSTSFSSSRIVLPRLFTTSSLLRSEPIPNSQAAAAAEAAAAQEPEEAHMSPAESSIAALLTSKLHPTNLLVQDISGGCGSMYAIDITSPAFRGLTMLKQQRLVNAALGDLVKEWHGVQIRTKVSLEGASS